MWEVQTRVYQNDKVQHCNDRPTIPSSPFFSIMSINGLTAEIANHALRRRRYQNLWWHPAFLSFSTFYRAALALWVWSVGACGPWRALCKRPSWGPAGPGLLTVPWHCCLSRKTSVGATERPWMKAVWSAQRMELEKIRLHPRVIVFPEQARARRPQYC